MWVMSAHHTFGTYRWRQAEHNCDSTNCAKIIHTLEWYQQYFNFAKNNILLEKQSDIFLIHIDNQILKQDKDEGLFLNLELLVAPDSNAQLQPLRSRSNAKTYIAAESFARIDTKN